MRIGNICAEKRDIFGSNDIGIVGQRKKIIGFVGSIATIFKPELEKVANEFECTLGKFVTNPIDDIANYFIDKTSN